MDKLNKLLSKYNIDGYIIQKMMNILMNILTTQKID